MLIKEKEEQNDAIWMEDYNYLFENEDLKILSQEEHIK